VIADPEFGVPAEDEGDCPFCGAILRGRPVCSDCDDEEIYCPECGYVEGVS
jgi:hypothetical protein